MGNNNDNPEHIKVKGGIQHSNEKPDKDFGDGKEADKKAASVAREGYKALQHAVGGLNDAVKSVQENMSYSFRPYRTEEESKHLIKIVGAVAGGSLLLTGAGGAFKDGAVVAAGGTAFVGNLVGFIANNVVTGSDKHMQQLIRKDYKGKHEAEMVFVLAPGKTLIVPVTPENIQAMAKAYEAGTAHVKADTGEHFVAGELEKDVRQAMLKSLLASGVKAEVLTYRDERDVKGERTPFTKDDIDIARATPIHGGVPVVDEPNSGLAVNKLKPSNGRIV